MREFLFVYDAVSGQVVQWVNVLELLQSSLQGFDVILSLRPESHAKREGRRERGRGGRRERGREGGREGSREV